VTRPLALNLGVFLPPLYRVRAASLLGNKQRTLLSLCERDKIARPFFSSSLFFPFTASNKGLLSLRGKTETPPFFRTEHAGAAAPPLSSFFFSYYEDVASEKIATSISFPSPCTVVAEGRRFSFPFYLPCSSRREYVALAPFYY